MKLQFALVSLALLAGCSKSNTDVVGVPGSSGGGIAPQSAADQCYVKCDADNQSGLTRFDLLDDCMEARCKPAYDDPATPKKACGPLDNGKITYGDVGRDKCMADMCCQQATDCANDVSCNAAATCYQRCAAMR